MPRAPRKALIVQRLHFTLTAEERERFRIVCHARWPQEGYASRFWKSVAEARGLDPATVIGSTVDPCSFTGLPEGHGKHWCWPSALNLKPAGNFSNVAFT